MVTLRNVMEKENSKKWTCFKHSPLTQYVGLFFSTSFLSMVFIKHCKLTIYLYSPINKLSMNNFLPISIKRSLLNQYIWTLIKFFHLCNSKNINWLNMQ